MISYNNLEVRNQEKKGLSELKSKYSAEYLETDDFEVVHVFPQSATKAAIVLKNKRVGSLLTWRVVFGEENYFFQTKNQMFVFCQDVGWTGGFEVS